MKIEAFVIQVRNWWCHIVMETSEGETLLLGAAKLSPNRYSHAILAEGCDFGVVGYAKTLDEAHKKQCKSTKYLSNVQLVEFKLLEQG